MIFLISSEGLSILAGTNSLKTGGIKVNVKASIVHEKYGGLKNDIALMKLEKPLTFSDSIKSIEIAKDEVPVNSNVTISGWGKVSAQGPISEDLRFNTLHAIDQEKCAEASGIHFDGLMCLGHSLNNGACNVSIVRLYKSFC